jgi:hypothetical protein
MYLGQFIRRGFCLAVFKRNPTPEIGKFVLFVREEQLMRTVDPLDVHFGPEYKILCGYDM